MFYRRWETYQDGLEREKEEERKRKQEIQKRWHGWRSPVSRSEASYLPKLGTKERPHGIHRSRHGQRRELIQRYRSRQGQAWVKKPVRP